MKKVTTCRCCGNKKLLLYLNLGKQPLANSYHMGKQLPYYPLQVLLCQNCFHSQLSVVIKPELLFKNYLYVTGTTNTFRNHCRALAKDALKRITTKKMNVLDIACNDGTLLEYFRDFGCKIYGVDPAENLRQITLKKNIPVLVDYWGEEIAKKLAQKFMIITGINVFAHVDRIDMFLKACTVSLEDDGILILEFPYCDKMIKYREFDTVYHEHLSYFLTNSFATLTTRMNFYIVDVLQTHIHGGSIRFFLKKGNKPHADKVLALIKKEENNGLFDVQTYKKFARQVIQNKKDLQDLVSSLKYKGEKVVGYGASAKGNTMLNYFKLNIEYIVDDNPLKWDFFTPGRNIPIKSPQTLKHEQKNLFIIILSWNFYTEISNKLRRLRSETHNDYFILYVPEVNLVPMFRSKEKLPAHMLQYD